MQRAGRSGPPLARQGYVMFAIDAPCSGARNSHDLIEAEALSGQGI
jgi:hypothetical protein